MQNFDRIDIAYRYTSFNQEGYGNFDYYSEIKLEFLLTFYAVKVDNEEVYKKLYSDELTVEEIKHLVNLITKRHKDFIEKAYLRLREDSAIDPMSDDFVEDMIERITADAAKKSNF